MVDVVHDHYDLFPTYHFDTADELRATSLSHEMELRLKERIYQLTDEVMSMDIVGNALEVAQLIQQQNFLKGKIHAFKELLEDSKSSRLLRG